MFYQWVLYHSISTISINFPMGVTNGGDGEIRTHETFRFASLAVKCLRPLGHVSKTYLFLLSILMFNTKFSTSNLITVANSMASFASGSVLR